MTDVERLLQQFIAEDRERGDADPMTYLGQVHGADRAELEALIDGYLARAPRRRFDATAYAGSPARSVVEDLGQVIRGRSGLWPALLPRLRHEARLKRTELVARLAEALGAEDRTDKVGGYYHAMERGLLPAAGVSDRVLDALGRIVGESAQALRDAGRAIGSSDESASSALAFARIAEPDPALAELTAGPEAPALTQPGDERDEIDELFTGGSDGDRHNRPSDT